MGGRVVRAAQNRAAMSDYVKGCEADRRELVMRLLEKDEDAAADITGLLFGPVDFGSHAWGLRYVTSPAVADPAEFFKMAHVLPEQPISLDHVACDKEIMDSGTLGGHLFAEASHSVLRAAVKAHHRIYGDGSDEFNWSPFEVRYARRGKGYPCELLDTLDLLNSMGQFSAYSDLHYTEFAEDAVAFLDDRPKYEEESLPWQQLHVYLRVVIAEGELDPWLMAQVRSFESRTRRSNAFTRLAESIQAGQIRASPPMEPAAKKAMAESAEIV